MEPKSRCDGAIDKVRYWGELFRVHHKSGVYDHAGDCKTSERCFDPKTRYSVCYQFSVPDKERGVILLFDANFAFQQPSPTVTGFEGHAKELRDTIIPSLTAGH